LRQSKETLVMVNGVGPPAGTALALGELEIRLREPPGVRFARLAQSHRLPQLALTRTAHQFAEPLMPLGATAVERHGFAPRRQGLAGPVLVPEALGERRVCLEPRGPELDRLLQILHRVDHSSLLALHDPHLPVSVGETLVELEGLRKLVLRDG